MDTLHGISASGTHHGKVRRVNEDACLELPDRGLWVVADGMGGHRAGDVASRMIVEELNDVGAHRYLAEFVDEVEERIQSVNLRLAEMVAAAREDTTIGSTVAVLLSFRHQAACLWAGDSRVYRYRNRELRQLTRDHSEVEELIADGRLSRAESRNYGGSNVITRAVGGFGDGESVEVRISDLRDGDRFLLCTDGLYKEVDETEMAEVLAEGDVYSACAQLLELALERGARDNVTVVLVDFRNDGGGR
jgi:protein phosphatase